MPQLAVAISRRTAPLPACLAEAPPGGAVDLYWLGQAGFALRSAGSLTLIDPYLSDALAEKYRDAFFKHRRMMPPPLLADELRGVGLLLATHAHSDHLDPGGVGTIMRLNPACRLACPLAAVPAALERGADGARVAGMGTMEKRRFGPVGVELLPAAHEELRPDAEGNTPCGGFVVEIEGMRIYHSGDCVPFPGLAEMLRGRGVHLALLPVNGRDAGRRARGVPGNFTLDEAAELCLAAGAAWLIPHHFGLFDFNTVAPEEIRAGLDKYAGRGLHWLPPDAAGRISAAWR